MVDKVSLSLLEKYSWIEAYSRQFFEKHPRIKKEIKKRRDKHAQGTNLQELKKINPQDWNIYKKLIYEQIDNEDIILIHSSIDGLAKIGVTSELCMDFLRLLVKDKSCTVVVACFPITNLKPPNEKSKPYDPRKTLCWTGMLSNAFIADPTCIRSRFPYNSLAAIGPKAVEMMSKDLDAILVYDMNSAWRYCYEHHAKILFLGVKASGANTMAIHMLPDFMCDEWPIDGWYEEKKYKVKQNDEIIEVTVKGQKSTWYKYVMEEGTSGRLKVAGLLDEKKVGDCYLGVVNDCHEMLDFLAAEVKRGKLTYMIPRKYYKKR